MNSISTFGLNSMVLDAAQRLQSAAATKEVQEASGLVGQTYGDLGSQSQYLISLENEVSQATTWASNAGTASNRVQAMYSAVGSMVDQLTSLRSTISSALSANDSSTLNSDAKGVLSDLASLMNTQQAGLYLFSGSRTSTPPVDVSDPPYAATTATSTVDTSYYQGDDSAASVRVSGQQTITYGVTADTSAFEEAPRVANVVANVSSGDTTTLQSAYDLITQAITDLTSVQGQLSVNASRLSDIQQQQTIYVSFVQSLADNIQSVDAAAVATQVSAYNTQLEASYSAIAEINKMHLVNYL